MLKILKNLFINAIASLVVMAFALTVFKTQIKSFLFPEIDLISKKLNHALTNIDILESKLDSMKKEEQETNEKIKELEDKLKTKIKDFVPISTKLLKLKEKVESGDPFSEELSFFENVPKFLLEKSKEHTKTIKFLLKELQSMSDTGPTSTKEFFQRIKILLRIDKDEATELLKKGDLKGAINKVSNWKNPPLKWIDEAKKRLLLNEAIAEFEAVILLNQTNQSSCQPTYRQYPQEDASPFL